MTRAFVGSGTLRYMSTDTTGGSGGLGPVEIHGARSYRVVRERRFTSSVFAVAIAPAAPLCEQAACDERDARGDCRACVVRGRQADIASMTAPADGVLSLLCEGMRPGEEVSVALRGDVFVDGCLESPSAVLAVVVEGNETARFEVRSNEVARGPLTFMRRTPAFHANGDGIAFATLDLVSCACGEASARCEIDPELAMAIEAGP